MKRYKKYYIEIAIVVLALCFVVGKVLYSQIQAKKYSGHGFEYMHGYSSTDFTDYMVYSENSKLVAIDGQPPFVIENEEDMPILDGAEACYPLYSAFAKAIYKDIDKTEKDWLSSEEDQRLKNGKIVTFTNSVRAFHRLVFGDKDIQNFIGRVDMFFGAMPSEDQFEFAYDNGVELNITPIAKEAFVFFVESDNPVDNLTTEQVKAIYHGDITNWAQVGGKNEEIIAFQRPKGSGSQTVMEYFMGDVSMREPKTYEIVDPMSGIVNRVAQYSNEKGALGYSFRYFVEELNQEKGVKLLSVDGISPSLENIENGTYPLITDVCLITRADAVNPYIGLMTDFILSPQGQEIVRKTGYGALMAD